MGHGHWEVIGLQGFLGWWKCSKTDSVDICTPVDNLIALEFYTLMGGFFGTWVIFLKIYDKNQYNSACSEIKGGKPCNHLNSCGQIN